MWINIFKVAAYLPHLYCDNISCIFVPHFIEIISSMYMA